MQHRVYLHPVYNELANRSQVKRYYFKQEFSDVLIFGTKIMVNVSALTNR